jgi:predicted lipid-binding transport protein (Tim44 family)
MPTSVRVAVGVLTGLAVLLLLSSLLTLLAWTAVVDAVADGQPDQSRSDAVLVVRINLVQSLVFGLLAAVSAVFLARRRGWARWSGLAAGLLLGLITLGATVLTGGIAVTSQLVLVLCAAAVASLLSRTTAAWAPTGSRRAG